MQAASGVRTVRIAGLESELRLGFAALHRMLVPFLDRVGVLPAPQREALDSVFGLADGPPPDRFLVSMSVLTLAAEIAAEQPLIWLVDDAHWVDRESLEVLGFVGRRLHADKTGLLFCAREASPGLAALDGLPTRRSAAAWTLRRPGPCSRQPSRSRSTPGWPHGSSTRPASNPLALRELATHLTPDQLAGRSPLPPRLPVGRRLHGHFLRQATTSRPPPAPGCCSPRQHRSMTPPRSGGQPQCWAWSPTPPTRLWLRTSCQLTREWRSGTRSSARRSTREHGRVTGAGYTRPWRASPGRTATQMRRRGTAPWPP